MIEVTPSPAYEKLLKEFFYSEEVVFEHKDSGQSVDEKSIILGDRAGPDVNISYLMHEMAHLAEIDDKRMRMRGWGFKFPQQVVCGQVCCEPDTMQMTAREVRALAYQSNILNHFGEDDSEEKLVESLTFMPDFIHVPLDDGRTAYDFEKECFRIPYEEVDDSKLRWLAAQVKKLRAEFSFERFCSEWHRKIKVLENREPEIVDPINGVAYYPSKYSRKSKR